MNDARSTWQISAQLADLLGVDDGGRIGMLQCSDLVLEVPDDVLTHINKTPGGRN
mgnify:CR=1 FL=1